MFDLAGASSWLAETVIEPVVVDDGVVVVAMHDDGVAVDYVG